jgi:predicted nucleotidyltransferase
MGRACEQLTPSESRLFQVDPSDRESILGVVRQALEAQFDVTFAYVHGSFLVRDRFHDVDVAVLLDGVDEDQASRRQVALADEVQGVVSHAPGLSARPPVDVRALNFAPLGFCYRVLLHSRLLLSRDEPLRVQWVADVVSRYLDIAPLRRRALKEAMMA